MTVSPSPLAWVQLTSSQDDGFNSLLKKALGSDTVPDVLTDILPYSIIVTNNVTVALSGVGVRFSVTKSDGKTVYRDYFYQSFGDKKAMRPPGKSILITPNATMNDVAHHRYVPDASAHVWDFVKLDKGVIVAANAIEASLDLAVSVDQLRAGPDAAGVLSKMHDQSAGYMSMVKEMAARLKEGHSDAELKAWLTPHAQRRVMRDDKFSSSQISVAKHWLEQINAGKRDEVEAFIKPIPQENPLLTYLESIKEGLQ
jgi:hypothetical protein